jgi:hypothetical protein
MSDLESKMEDLMLTLDTLEGVLESSCCVDVPDDQVEGLSAVGPETPKDGLDGTGKGDATEDAIVLGLKIDVAIDVSAGGISIDAIEGDALRIDESYVPSDSEGYIDGGGSNPAEVPGDAVGLCILGVSDDTLVTEGGSSDSTA